MTRIQSKMHALVVIRLCCPGVSCIRGPMTTCLSRSPSSRSVCYSWGKAIRKVRLSKTGGMKLLIRA